MAPQLIAANGALRRAERSCRARAVSALPVDAPAFARTNVVEFCVSSNRHLDAPDRYGRASALGFFRAAATSSRAISAFPA